VCFTSNLGFNDYKKISFHSSQTTTTDTMADDDGPLSAAESGTIFTQATSHPLELEEVAFRVESLPGNDDDSAMEGYSTQEDLEEIPVVESLPNGITNGTNGTPAADPPGDYAGSGEVDLELGIRQRESTHDDEESSQDGSDNTDTILAAEAEQQEDTDEEQTMTCRMRMWQYTRFFLHVALFPILVITSVAIPVLIVMFCFALMFVAMVVLLCVYYCCSPRRGDQAAVPFHVLIRQILEAVEDETNGIRDPFADAPKLSREEIQNSLVRRELVLFECTDENNQVVKDEEDMDEATREERMHQDMFPVLPDLETGTTRLVEPNPDKENKSKPPSADTCGPFRGIRRRWSSRTRRRKGAKKDIEVLDYNNTYELRVSQQCISFKTDPQINHSKHFLLTRTFVFSAPLDPQKVHANRSDDDDDEDDEEARNNNTSQRSSGRYSLAAAAMEVDDDSSSSGFFPVMAPSSSSSSSYSETSSEGEEGAAAGESASTSDESFLLEDCNENSTNVAPHFASREITGIQAPNAPPIGAFPRHLSDSPAATTTPIALKVTHDTDADNELELDLGAVLSIGGGHEDDKALAPDPAADVVKSDVSQPASNVSKALELEFDLECATKPVDVVSDVETDPAAHEEQMMGKEEGDDGLTHETRQVERWVLMKDTDDLDTASQPTDDADLGIAMAKASTRLEMQQMPKERSPSDLVSLEEAKTEITADESIVDTVPHPPMDIAYADDEAATGVAANSPAPATNDDTTNSPQVPTPPNDHRGISSYCNICLLEYEVGDIVVWSRRPHGCHHAWHEDCLIDWLQRKPTCPSCRQEFFAVADAQQPSDTTANGDNHSLEDENHSIVPESTHSILVDSAHSSRFLW
jgi:Ring finger domain